jgi:hypothetical protein
MPELTNEDYLHLAKIRMLVMVAVAGAIEKVKESPVVMPIYAPSTRNPNSGKKERGELLFEVFCPVGGVDKFGANRQEECEKRVLACDDLDNAERIASEALAFIWRMSKSKSAMVCELEDAFGISREELHHAIKNAIVMSQDNISLIALVDEVGDEELLEVFEAILGKETVAQYLKKEVQSVEPDSTADIGASATSLDFEVHRITKGNKKPHSEVAAEKEEQSTYPQDPAIRRVRSTIGDLFGSASDLSKNKISTRKPNNCPKVSSPLSSSLSKSDGHLPNSDNTGGKES